MNTRRSQIRKGVLIMVAHMIAFSAFAQVFVNGGFEYFGNLDSPANWRAGVGEIKLDSIEKHSGKYSARITDGKSPLGNYILAFTTLSEHVVKNKKIEVKAMLKRDVADTIKTAIFLQKLMADGTLSPPYFGEWYTGKGEWVETSFCTVVEPPFLALIAGVLTTGQGTVWLDDLEVFADGLPLDYQPRMSPLTTNEKAWLEKNVIPLDDKKVGSVLGNARIVGLGDVTHGAHDIMEANYGIAKQLIEQHGFTIIACESTTNEHWVELNKFLSGQGNDAKRFGSWTVHTDFLEWAADYNRRTGNNLQFMGIENEDTVGDGSLTDLLSGNQAGRDETMARHIEGIATQFPQKKIIFLAHNLHVENRYPGKNRRYTNGSAGYFLRKKFGEKYYSVASCFYEGSYGSWVPKRIDGEDKFTRQNFDAQPAHPGSYEYLLNSTAQAAFFLPLRDREVNDNNRWLDAPMEFRTIGAVYEEYGFSPTLLTEQFDAVMFIHKNEPVKSTEWWLCSDSDIRGHVAEFACREQLPDSSQCKHNKHE